jgi:hypothetical protein
VTVPFTPELEPVVRIWVPLINCLEKKPGFDDFCAEAPPLDAYRPDEQGKSVWFYQSCASHGCNIPGGEYFNGWPSYMVDVHRPRRIGSCSGWPGSIGCEGELYYSMNEAYGQKDPWTDIRLFGGNGDGTLFYPGRPARIGGHTDIPDREHSAEADSQRNGRLRIPGAAGQTQRAECRRRICRPDRAEYLALGIPARGISKRPPGVGRDAESTGWRRWI